MTCSALSEVGLNIGNWRPNGTTLGPLFFYFTIISKSIKENPLKKKKGFWLCSVVRTVLAEQTFSWPTGCWERARCCQTQTPRCHYCLTELLRRLLHLSRLAAAHLHRPLAHGRRSSSSCARWEEHDWIQPWRSPKITFNISLYLINCFSLQCKYIISTTQLMDFAETSYF